MALNREQALALLQKYNKEPFHIQHGLTVEGVMRWYAQELGYGEEVDRNMGIRPAMWIEISKAIESIEGIE